MASGASITLLMSLKGDREVSRKLKGVAKELGGLQGVAKRAGTWSGTIERGFLRAGVGATKFASTATMVAGALHTINAAATVFVGASLTGLVKQFAQVSSGAMQTRAAFEQVFDSTATSQMDSYIAGVSKQYKLATDQMEAFSIRFGTMGSTAGLAGEELAKFSSSLIGNAIDLKAMYNVENIEEVFQALQSGLAGETEPLRKYGIFLSDASLKAFALKKGLGDVWSTMTEGEKVALRQQFIMENMGAAAGQAARESDSYEMAIAGLQGQWRQFLVDGGKPVLRWMHELLKVGSDVAGDALPKLAAWMDRAIPPTETLASQMKALGDKVKSVVTTFTESGFDEAFEEAFGSKALTIFTTLRDTFSNIGVIVSELVGGIIDGLFPSLNEAGEQVSGPAEQFKKLTKFISDNKESVRSLGETIGKWLPTFGMLSGGSVLLFRGFQGLSIGIGAGEKLFKFLGNAKKVRKEVKMLGDDFNIAQAKIAAAWETMPNVKGVKKKPLKQMSIEDQLRHQDLRKTALSKKASPMDRAKARVELAETGYLITPGMERIGEQVGKKRGSYAPDGKGPLKLPYEYAPKPPRMTGSPDGYPKTSMASHGRKRRFGAHLLRGLKDDRGSTDMGTLVSMGTMGLGSKKGTGLLANAGGGIGRVFKAVGSPLRLLTGGFKALFTLVKANPIVAVLTTVGSLLSAAWFGSEKFRNAVGGLGDKIGQLGGFLATTFGPVFEWLGQKFSKFGAWLGDGLAVAIDWASTKLGEFTGWLQGTVLPWWQGTAWPAISQAIQAASEAIGPVWETVKGWFASFWDWMMGTAVPWWTGTAWPVIMAAVQTAGQLISPVIGAVMAVMSALWNWVSGTFLPWWQGTAWPAISLAVSQAGAIVNPIITTIQNTITNIKTGFEVGKAVMIQFWDSLKEKVLSVWNRIQEPLNLIRSGMDTIGAAGSSAWGTVTGWFGGGRASGGPVLPGVAYRVGELGPETFVPTSPGMIIPHRPTAKLAAVGPGGVRRDAPLVHIGQITVQSGRDLVSEAQVRKLGRAIAAEVDRRVLIDRQVG